MGEILLKSHCSAKSLDPHRVCVWTLLERPNRDKHSSLILKYVNYGRKNFYNNGSSRRCCKTLLPVTYAKSASVKQARVRVNQRLYFPLSATDFLLSATTFCFPLSAMDFPLSAFHPNVTLACYQQAGRGRKAESPLTLFCVGVTFEMIRTG